MIEHSDMAPFASLFLVIAKCIRGLEVLGAGGNVEGKFTFRVGICTFEPWMLQSLLGSEAFVRVFTEHATNEILGFF